MILLRPLNALVVLLALTFVDARSADLLIRNVHVVRGDGRTLGRATVIVSGGRIARIETGPLPARAQRVIDGGGRTLVPGLIDAHVRVTPGSLRLFLRSGVTTVRDVHNDRAFIMGLAADEEPDVPDIIAAGPAIDGPGSVWPGDIEVETVADGRAAVRDAVRHGASVIVAGAKVHPALLTVIVAEAAARGVPVAADLGKTNAVEAANAGITSLERLSGIADAASADPERLRRLYDDFVAGWTASEREWLQLDPGRLRAVARTLLEHDVVLVPALALHEAIARLGDPSLQKRASTSRAAPPRRQPGSWDLLDRAGWTDEAFADFREALPRLQRFVGEYAGMGGRIAAGTGAPQPLVVPGASLHRELQLYVAGGMSPAQALESATGTAAALLGIGYRTGTIDVGKDADLVLLDGDPLRDIRATERIRLVVKRGVIVYEP